MWRGSSTASMKAETTVDARTCWAAGVIIVAFSVAIVIAAVAGSS